MSKNSKKRNSDNLLPERSISKSFDDLSSEMKQKLRSGYAVAFCDGSLIPKEVVGSRVTPSSYGIGALIFCKAGTGNSMDIIEISKGQNDKVFDPLSGLFTSLNHNGKDKDSVETGDENKCKEEKTTAWAFYSPPDEETLSEIDSNNCDTLRVDIDVCAVEGAAILECTRWAWEHNVPIIIHTDSLSFIDMIDKGSENMLNRQSDKAYKSILLQFESEIAKGANVQVRKVDDVKANLLHNYCHNIALKKARNYKNEMKGTIKKIKSDLPLTPASNGVKKADVFSNGKLRSILSGDDMRNYEPPIPTFPEYDESQPKIKKPDKNGFLSLIKQLGKKFNIYKGKRGETKLFGIIAKRGKFYVSMAFNTFLDEEQQEKTEILLQKVAPSLQRQCNYSIDKKICTFTYCDIKDICLELMELAREKTSHNIEECPVKIYSNLLFPGGCCYYQKKDTEYGFFIPFEQMVSVENNIVDTAFLCVQQSLSPITFQEMEIGKTYVFGLNKCFSAENDFEKEEYDHERIEAEVIFKDEQGNVHREKIGKNIKKGEIVPFIPLGLSMSAYVPHGIITREKFCSISTNIVKSGDVKKLRDFIYKGLTLNPFLTLLGECNYNNDDYFAEVWDDSLQREREEEKETILYKLIQTEDEDNNSLLYYSVLFGREEMTKWLLINGALKGIDSPVYFENMLNKIQHNRHEQKAIYILDEQGYQKSLQLLRYFILV